MSGSMGTGDFDITTIFPRIELPPVPTFGAEPAPADGEVTPLLDEPLGTWQPPFAPPFGGEQQYRSMVERVAALSSLPIAAHEVPATAPAPAPIVDLADAPVAEVARPAISAPSPEASIPVMPQLAASPPLAALPASRIAIGIMLVLCALLAWGSRMAFSPGLLALSSLLLAQLAAAAGTTATHRRSLALGAGIAAIAVGLLAATQALSNLTSDMAMVAGLFVLVAGLPTIVLYLALQVVLRRRGERIGPADLALRDGWKLRAGALAGLLVAAFLVRDSFSAKPDAVVTLGIVALVVVTLLPVVRGAGRTAD